MLRQTFKVFVYFYFIYTYRYGDLRPAQCIEIVGFRSFPLHSFQHVDDIAARVLFFRVLGRGWWELGISDRPAKKKSRGAKSGWSPKIAPSTEACSRKRCIDVFGRTEPTRKKTLDRPDHSDERHTDSLRIAVARGCAHKIRQLPRHTLYSYLFQWWLRI